MASGAASLRRVALLHPTQLGPASTDLCTQQAHDEAPSAALSGRAALRGRVSSRREGLPRARRAPTAGTSRRARREGGRAFPLAAGRGSDAAALASRAIPRPCAPPPPRPAPHSRRPTCPPSPSRRTLGSPVPPRRPRVLRPRRPAGESPGRAAARPRASSSRPQGGR